MRLERAIIALHKLGAIKFGSFTLKSGMVAPIYVDLRLIISSPALLKEMGELLWEKLSEYSFDQIVGVPYTALPLASYLSLQYQIPMLMKRKEAKNYGTKKLIEGIYQKGERCVIIEDLVTSGASLLETVEPLEKEGLLIEGMVAFLDREQGGRALLEQKGYQVNFVTTLTEVLEVLCEEKCLSSLQKEEIQAYIYGNQVCN